MYWAYNYVPFFHSRILLKVLIVLCQGVKIKFLISFIKSFLPDHLQVI